MPTIGMPIIGASKKPILHSTVMLSCCGENA